MLRLTIFIIGCICLSFAYSANADICLPIYPSGNCSTISITAGSCCLTNRQCATPTSANNTNPLVANITISPPTTSSVTMTLANLQLSGTANYPLGSYTLVSYAPTATTYIPLNPPIITWFASTLQIGNYWAGTYTFVFAST